MNKHSRGPWRIAYKRGTTHIESADNESLMCDETYYPWVPENMADWDLIASAPELLEVLEIAVSAAGPGDFWVSDACKAIAKAKGKASQ